MGYSLGALSGREPAGTPVSARTFLKAFHDAERGVGIRLVLGFVGRMLPKSKWLADCNVVHQYIDFFVSLAVRESSGSIEHPDRFGQREARTLIQGLVRQTEDAVEIRSQILQGMMATQDTTSVLLSNTFFLLARSPLVWKQLRDEVSVLELSALTLEVVRSLRVTRSVLNECKCFL